MVIRVLKTTDVGDGANEFSRNIVIAKVWNRGRFESYTYLGCE